MDMNLLESQRVQILILLLYSYPTLRESHHLQDVSPYL